MYGDGRFGLHLYLAHIGRVCMRVCICLVLYNASFHFLAFVIFSNRPNRDKKERGKKSLYVKDNNKRLFHKGKAKAQMNG